MCKKKLVRRDNFIYAAQFIHEANSMCFTQMFYSNYKITFN